MLDFATRRFTVRLGRSNKSGLVSGEPANKRASVVGRKTSARRVSVRNSSALRRAPSGAGGLHRGTSVRRSPSAVRRGTSVRRAPSAARRNSKRMSAYVDGIPPATSFQALGTEPGPATTKSPVLPDTVPVQPSTSKSFFSKLTSRFRGRSKTPKLHIPSSPLPASESSAIAATFSATNLSPVGFVPPRSPSLRLRSPSPGSRVTFVDTPVEPPKVPENQTGDTPATEQPRVDTPSVEAVKKSPEESDPTSPVEEIVDEGDGSDDEWVDADDDGLHPEPRIPTTNSDSVIDSGHAGSTTTEPPVPEDASGQVQIPENIFSPAKSEESARGQPEVVQLQAEVLSDLAQGSIGMDVRVSQWLAATPVVVDEKSKDDGRVKSLEGIVDGEAEVEAATLSKVEARKRPPRIIVPGSSLSSNNPFRIPLPPSPSPSSISTLPETNPFRSLVAAESSLVAEASSPEGLIPPPSPSIFLTPAGQHDDFDLDVPRKSEELLTVDSTQFPLPPSPTPSHASLASPIDDSPTSPSTSATTVARNGSVSTSGGRSLSTTPSTRGPATPTSIRIPGHPAFANFSFGGPHSPSLKIEDWEEGEEERRGRSLEVSGGKRRMRSTSPGLDAVLEGDESRRSSRASVEELERKGSPELKQPLSPLPIIEQAATFGQKRGDDTDSEHEDEAGFFAFAEHRLEAEERKAVEARQLEVPKRSKTMSFLGVGFGKRKSTVGDPRPVSPAMARSATSSGLLSLPASAPKRSSTLEVSPNRFSRLVPGQRSSTMMTLAEPRVALSPTMYTIGDIHTETGKIEDDESRRLSEAVFMF